MINFDLKNQNVDLEQLKFRKIRTKNQTIAQKLAFF